MAHPFAQISHRIIIIQIAHALYACQSVVPCLNAHRVRPALIAPGVTPLPHVHVLLTWPALSLCALAHHLLHGSQLHQHVQLIDVALNLIALHARRIQCVGGVLHLVAALLATRLVASTPQLHTVRLAVMIHGDMGLGIVYHRWSHVPAGQAVVHALPSKGVAGAPARLHRIVHSPRLPRMRH